MSSFAERYGYRQARSVIQRESMDQALRNALWDALHLSVLQYVSSSRFYERESGELGVKLTWVIWNGFFKRTIDTIPQYWSEVLEELREFFMRCEWYDVYEFLEFVAKHTDRGEALAKAANAFMKREMAAYRFVGREIVEITDENEIREIERAIDTVPKPVATHLQSALSLLADRTDPDYRNSIKESISAVEAAAQALTGDNNATLGAALRALPAPLPPAFAKALSTLYGYTSDANGIRHALSEESTVDAAEARFMLIACSAFINLLRERGNKTLA